MTDAAEIAAGAPDCNANGIPDICDVASTTLDCNSNDLVDSCEIAADPTRDCNLNGLLDSCDIATASSTDLNANARPDECEFIVGGSGFATLQAAIAAAPNGETILVAPGTFTGPFAVAGKSLTIRSLAGAASTILSGVGVTADAILTIEGIATNNTSIDGFTFTAGTAGHLFGVVRCGGGLFMLDTTADITNCRFESNSTNFAHTRSTTADSSRTACSTTTPRRSTAAVLRSAQATVAGRSSIAPSRATSQTRTAAARTFGVRRAASPIASSRPTRRNCRAARSVATFLAPR